MTVSAAVRAALAALATLAACSAAAAPACESDAALPGMRERVNTLRDQMNRIEWTTDRDERRVLIDLHAKHLNESLRELRRREIGAPCRMELMTAMLEEMSRLQGAIIEQHTH